LPILAQYWAADISAFPGRKRPELAGLDRAEHVMILRQTDAWQRLMVPECRKQDEERSARGLRFLYESEELEVALLFAGSRPTRPREGSSRAMTPARVNSSASTSPEAGDASRLRQRS
jgi:hypothetical protein